MCGSRRGRARSRIYYKLRHRNVDMRFAVLVETIHNYLRERNRGIRLSGSQLLACKNSRVVKEIGRVLPNKSDTYFVYDTEAFGMSSHDAREHFHELFGEAFENMLYDILRAANVRDRKVTIPPFRHFQARIDGEINISEIRLYEKKYGRKHLVFYCAPIIDCGIEYSRILQFASS